PTPTLNSLTPESLSPGAFTLTVNGNEFIKGAKVLWNGDPLTTNFVSPSQLSATGMASQAGSDIITVANPGPDAVSSSLPLTVPSDLSVNISPTVANPEPDAVLSALPLTISSDLSVNILPTSVNLLPVNVIIPVNGVQQFTAIVTGTTNTAVTWSLIPPVGVNPRRIGTIDATGKYTAPPTPLPGFANLVVKSVSIADPSASASTTIMIRYPTPTLTSLTPESLSPGA